MSQVPQLTSKLPRSIPALDVTLVSEDILVGQTAMSLEKLASCLKIIAA